MTLPGADGPSKVTCEVEHDYDDTTTRIPGEGLYISRHGGSSLPLR